MSDGRINLPVDSKYINDFHKESVEKKLKAIEEMKKTPANYEEELKRHSRINQESYSENKENE
jgi:hypothetical protein